MTRRLVSLVVGLAFVAAGCSGSTADANRSTSTTPSTGLDVVTTTPILADLARAVVGDHGTVVSLDAAGADPHDVHFSDGDLAAARHADLVLANGGVLEPDLDALVAATREQGVPLLLATHELSSPIETLDGQVDPHFWHDPDASTAVVEGLARRLGRLRPELRSTFADGARRYADRLDRLRRDVQDLLRTVPEVRRGLVTQHDFFRYFARRYGMTIAATVVPGLSTLSTPSASSRAAAVQTVDDQGICAIFTLRSVSDSLSEAVASEADHQVQVVPVYADTLAPDLDYVDSMLANARTIADTLTSCG